MAVPEKGGRSAKAGAESPPRRRSQKEAASAAASGLEKERTRRRTGSRKAARIAMKDQVSEELLRLRPLLREVGTAVLERLDGEMAAMAQFFDGDPVAGERPVLPTAEALKGMLGRIRGLKVKPKKGRVKDLARFESMLRDLSESMPPER
jgi:hypothetical protein